MYYPDKQNLLIRKLRDHFGVRLVYSRGSKRSKLCTGQNRNCAQVKNIATRIAEQPNYLIRQQMMTTNWLLIATRTS